MPDPWLTEEGEPCEALVKIGMPEWDDGMRCHLWISRVGDWQTQVHTTTHGWRHISGITAHEAHALIEKHADEWLRQHDIDVFLYPGCGWNVFKWVPVDALRGHRRAYLLKFGTWEFVTPGERDRIAVFDTEPEALQAAILAEGE